MSELALADILRIEDAADLLEITDGATGIALWPQVRVQFLRQILGDLVFTEGAPDMPMRRPPVRAAATLARSVAHNARTLASRKVPTDLLITTEASVDQLRDGKWFNRQADYFAAEAPAASLVLTDQHEWTWPFPRVNRDVYFHAPLQLATSARGRIAPGGAHGEAGTKLADLAFSRAREQLGWSPGDNRRTAFARYCARKLATTAPRYRAYRRLLERMRPKLLLNSSGCYGHIATMLVAAHDLRIPTAEYQHGAVSEGHDAYNFGEGVRNDARLQHTLPRHFLSYGEWWNAHFNAPVAKVAIGNPNRESIAARQQSASSAGARTILILSDGIEFGLYTRLAEEIARLVEPRGYDVLLRPHPLERNEVLHSWSPTQANLALDRGSDIYASLAGARAVVSEVSTGLFEAVGLVDKVIMLDTAKARFAYPDPPFAAAAGASEVAAIATGEDRAQADVEAQALWADDWRGRFRAFLKAEAGIA